MFTKLRFLRCFNSGLFTNQVTNVLTEVVPFCKSGHIYNVDMFRYLIYHYITTE